MYIQSKHSCPFVLGELLPVYYIASNPVVSLVIFQDSMLSRTYKRIFLGYRTFPLDLPWDERWAWLDAQDFVVHRFYFFQILQLHYQRNNFITLWVSIIKFVICKYGIVLVSCIFNYISFCNAYSSIPFIFSAFYEVFECFFFSTEAF